MELPFQLLLVTVIGYYLPTLRPVSLALMNAPPMEFLRRHRSLLQLFLRKMTAVYLSIGSGDSGGAERQREMSCNQ